MKSILLIEDEEPFASNLTDELKEYGLFITKFDNGEEAIKSLSEISYDGVILDLKLKHDSKIHGIGIVEWIKNFNSNLPVIVITAHTHLALRVFEYGVDALMIKPVEGKHISQYLKRAIDFRGLKNQLKIQEIDMMKLQSDIILLKRKNKLLSSRYIYNATITLLIVSGFIVINYNFAGSITSQIFLFIISIILLLGGDRITKVIFKLFGQEMQIESEKKPAPNNVQNDNTP